MGIINVIKEKRREAQEIKLSCSCYGCKYLTDDPDGRYVCQLEKEKQCSPLTRVRKELKKEFL